MVVTFYHFGILYQVESERLDSLITSFAMENVSFTIYIQQWSHDAYLIIWEGTDDDAVGSYKHVC